MLAADRPRSQETVQPVIQLAWSVLTLLVLIMPHSVSASPINYQLDFDVSGPFTPGNGNDPVGLAGTHWEIIWTLDNSGQTPSLLGDITRWDNNLTAELTISGSNVGSTNGVYSPAAGLFGADGINGGVVLADDRTPHTFEGEEPKSPIDYVQLPGVIFSVGGHSLYTSGVQAEFSTSTISGGNPVQPFTFTSADPQKVTLGSFGYTSVANGVASNITLSAVPEPSTAALFAMGLAGCALVRRRSRSIS